MNIKIEVATFFVMVLILFYVALLIESLIAWVYTKIKGDDKWTKKTKHGF